METPELEKIAANQEKSQSIGEFIEWLQSEKDICFCITLDDHKALLMDDMNSSRITQDQYDEAMDDLEGIFEDTDSDFAYMANPFNIESTLAEYFNVDLAEAEKERQGLLDEIRNQVSNPQA